MTAYTLETLKNFNYNSSYDREHRLTVSDLEKANNWVEFIEDTRSDDTPQVGDIVEFTNKYGDWYEDTHIDGIEENELEIMERPSVLWVSKSKDGTLCTPGTSGSGSNYIPSELKLIGKRKKVFKDWGHCGPTGNGAFFFEAVVNVWEYQEKDLEFTTKTHNKFYLDVAEETSEYGYKYFITNSDSYRTAFKTLEEYQDWLKTFKGVERESTGFYTKLIWTFKQDLKRVPLEEYLTVGGVVSTHKGYGVVKECKRVTNGTTITTYLPIQNSTND
ncbi:DUF4121 family protein [Priestia sp. SB1]|uniref:DUF4121 family protein n=1 Tax=Priestia sp. SB1 TaxID=3132359 RepID=UPI00317A5D3A